MTAFIRISTQPKKDIKAVGGLLKAKPTVILHLFVKPKSWTKNRFLTPGPGPRAANVVHLRFALPGPGLQVENLLSVRLLKRFWFHDETSVKGRDSFSTVNLSSVELYLSHHLLKKPLVAYTDGVYQHRRRWFFTQMIVKGKFNPREIEVSILLPFICVEITGAVFFFLRFTIRDYFMAVPVDDWFSGSSIWQPSIFFFFSFFRLMEFFVDTFFDFHEAAAIPARR